MHVSIVSEILQNHTVKKTITWLEAVKLQQNTVHNLTDLQLSTVFSFLVILYVEFNKINKYCIIIFKSKF